MKNKEWMDPEDSLIRMIMVVLAFLLCGYILHTLEKKDDELIQDVVTYESGTYKVEDGKIKERK